jgi:hypothetical protein
MSPSDKNKKFDLPVLLSPLEGSAIFTGGVIKIKLASIPHMKGRGKTLSFLTG